jgi:hypothetical protein
MPYSVVKVVGGYKVRSDNGTMLSKKPMSREKAEAQRIAATLSYLKTGR